MARSLPDWTTRTSSELSLESDMTQRFWSPRAPPESDDEEAELTDESSESSESEEAPAQNLDMVEINECWDWWQ